MRKQENNDGVKADSTLFNMSLATLERINELFKYNNQCSINMNVQGWLVGLQTLLIEVAPMMDDTEMNEFNKLYEEIVYVSNPRTVNEREDNFANRETIRKADTFLRKILWNKGLTMAKKEDITKQMMG